MLLIYRTATGEVVDNTGTNSLLPEGPPDDLAYLNTDAAGIDRDDLSLLRLNDEDDAGLVAGVLACGCTVLDGTVTLNDAAPEPSPDPAPTPESLAAAITAAQAAHDAQQQVLDDLKAQAAALAEPSTASPEATTPA